MKRFEPERLDKRMLGMACAMLLLIAACSRYQFYEGAARSKAEVATIDPHASGGGFLLRIDGEFGPFTDNFYGFSTKHFKAVDLLPGSHALLFGIPEGMTLFKTRIYQGAVDLKAGGKYSAVRMKGIPACLDIKEELNGSARVAGKACLVPQLDSLEASLNSLPEGGIAKLVWDPGFFSNLFGKGAEIWLYSLNSAWGTGGFFRANSENKFSYRLPPGPVTVVAGGFIGGKYLVSPVTLTGTLEAGKSYTFKPFKVEGPASNELGGFNLEIVPVPTQVQ